MRFCWFQHKQKVLKTIRQLSNDSESQLELNLQFNNLMIDDEKVNQILLLENTSKKNYWRIKSPTIRRQFLRQMNQ